MRRQCILKSTISQAGENTVRRAGGRDDEDSVGHGLGVICTLGMSPLSVFRCQSSKENRESAGPHLQCECQRLAPPTGSQSGRTQPTLLLPWPVFVWR